MAAAAAADDIRHELLYGGRLLPCYAQRPRNLDDMLRRAVALGDDSPALEDKDTRLTYGELDRLAQRTADALSANGISAGKRMALFIGSRVEFVALLFGIWRLGAVASPGEGTPAAPAPTLSTTGTNGTMETAAANATGTKKNAQG